MCEILERCKTSQTKINLQKSSEKGETTITTDAYDKKWRRINKKVEKSSLTYSWSSSKGRNNNVKKLDEQVLKRNSRQNFDKLFLSELHQTGLLMLEWSSIRRSK